MTNSTPKTAIAELDVQSDTTSEVTLDQVRYEFGATAGAQKKTKSFAVAELKINSVADKGVYGAFCINHDFTNDKGDEIIGERVYATGPVKLRCLSSHIQFFHWGEAGTLISKSMLATTSEFSRMKEKLRDSAGGFNCGTPSYEESVKMTSSEREVHQNKNKYRIAYGLVSFSGRTNAGEELTLENVPCVLRHKRKSYGKMWHQFIKELPQGTDVWDYECSMVAEKQTTPKGASYFVMGFNPDFKNRLIPDGAVENSILHVHSLIGSENARIDKSWTEATFANIENKADEVGMAKLESLDFSDS